MDAKIRREGSVIGVYCMKRVSAVKRVYIKTEYWGVRGKGTVQVCSGGWVVKGLCFPMVGKQDIMVKDKTSKRISTSVLFRKLNILKMVASGE